MDVRKEEEREMWFRTRAKHTHTHTHTHLHKKREEQNEIKVHTHTHTSLISRPAPVNECLWSSPKQTRPKWAVRRAAGPAFGSRYPEWIFSFSCSSSSLRFPRCWPSFDFLVRNFRFDCQTTNFTDKRRQWRRKVFSLQLVQSHFGFLFLRIPNFLSTHASHTFASVERHEKTIKQCERNFFDIVNHHNKLVFLIN